MCLSIYNPNNLWLSPAPYPHTTSQKSPSTGRFRSVGHIRLPQEFPQLPGVMQRERECIPEFGAFLFPYESQTRWMLLRELTGNKRDKRPVSSSKTLPEKRRTPLSIPRQTISQLSFNNHQDTGQNVAMNMADRRVWITQVYFSGRYISSLVSILQLISYFFLCRSYDIT